jgi:DNA processing protein
MDKENLKYLIAVLQIPKVGPVLAKNLIAYCGSAEEIFRQKKSHLVKIPGIGQKLAANIGNFKDFTRAEEEINFIEKHKIEPLFFLDENYPQRLKEIQDAPLLLYYKGNVSLNAKRVLAVVGTRKATDYGKKACERLIEELAPYNVMVVSGLAYGIDYLAHKASVNIGLPTVGVMGNGLDKIYPNQHRGLAVKMIENGGLLTEYLSGTEPEREHFPARNRIVAGMADGLVLVETAKKGGALITAEIASSYNREVFAFPGRAGDEYSEGCNHFIKINKAYLIEGASDIAYHMGWDLKYSVPTKREKYSGLSEIEKSIVEKMTELGRVDIDTLCFVLGYNSSELSLLLLEMEFKGVVQALPGKYFRLL